MYPDKVKETLTEHGVELFHTLFEISPMLVELFPFKDGDGQPIKASKCFFFFGGGGEREQPIV